MAPQRWLVTPDGIHLPVGIPGVVIGRSPECDLVVEHPQVSRRHLHARLTEGGVELVPLGRNPVEVDGAAHSAPVVVDAGARITVGLVTVTLTRGAAAPEEPSLWMLDGGTVRFGLPRLPLAIGGGDGDDLIVPEWPPAAVRIHRVRAALFVEADGDGVRVAGTPVAVGAIEPVGDGDAIEVAGRALVVRRQVGAELATRAVISHPDRVEVHVLPRGGRLSLTYGGVEKSLLVSERRLELLSVLLAPPSPHRAGDFVPDAVILARVWPRSDRADLSDLNALVHRLRRDLIKAGIDGPALVIRIPGGGGTRFVVGASTQVAVRTA